MSSLLYPQSNGKAESAVQSMKNLISATWAGSRVDEVKIARTLLQYRNTPSRRDGLSPVQKLFGRPLQDTLPAHRRAFAPEWQRSTVEAEEQDRSNREYVEQYCNRRARPLIEIHVGSNIALQDTVTKRWDIYGIVVEVGPHRRYYVKMAGGRVLARNRCVPFSPPTPSTADTPPAAGSASSFQPALPRHSTRSHVRPRRLIEEITF